MCNKKTINLKTSNLLKVFFINLILIKIIWNIILFFIFLPFLIFYCYELYYINAIEFYHITFAYKKQFFFFTELADIKIVANALQNISEFNDIKTYRW